MQYSNRWKIISDLGEGGQGKVYRALDKSKFEDHEKIRDMLIDATGFFASIQTRGDKYAKYESFEKSIVDLMKMEDPINHGALKVLHEPKDARDADLASERIKREIEAMVTTSHPNLLKILDYDKDARWYVSQYHHKGSLHKRKDMFKGKFIESLRAIRPLVEGLSILHKRAVHRDIKPQNVFLDNDDNLILGDFGLVFFTDDQHSRISATWENVGSRDWMPAWAMGMKIEDIKPSFDVFCLGKLLWFMVSGFPILRLWYFDRKENDLEIMFPNSLSIEFANPLLKKCIVEDEHNCLPDGSAFLDEIDKILRIVDVHAALIGENIRRRCKVCGVGDYRLIVDKNTIDIRNFGFNPVAGHTFKIFTCSHCGHVQIFDFNDRRDPRAWKS